jgi:hypothetical protein
MIQDKKLFLIKTYFDYLSEMKYAYYDFVTLSS